MASFKPKTKILSKVYNIYRALSTTYCGNKNSKKIFRTLFLRSDFFQFYYLTCCDITCFSNTQNFSLEQPIVLEHAVYPFSKKFLKPHKNKQKLLKIL